MPRTQALVLVFAVVLCALPLTVAQADPPPPCTCELCLADPEVKCNRNVNGSCVHLLRSGVCLGELAEATTQPALLEAEPLCSELDATQPVEQRIATDRPTEPEI